MPVQIVLRKEQLDDLNVLRELGAEVINSVIKKLSTLDPTPIRPSEIQKTLNDSLPGRSEEVAIMMRLLMHFYTLMRQRGLTTKQLVDAITNGIVASKTWSEQEIYRWKSLETSLLELFSLPTVWTVVKALDLSYDYAYLLHNLKIITDIRPVFNEDAKKIQGSVITHTLRLHYESEDGTESLSIAIDDEDIKKMIIACNRALTKANTAKNYLQSHDVKGTIICGEVE